MTEGRKRILIIDDDIQALLMWRAAVAYVPHQCVVDTARSRCEALEKMAGLDHEDSERYDLIIVDLVSANPNGPELTHTVRTLYGDVPIVWITPHHHCDTQAQARQLGVYCCLDEPISLALMRQVVWEALETRPTSPSLARSQ